MSRHTRRTVLAGTGLTIATLGAGCLDETGDPGGTDDGNGGENGDDRNGNGSNDGVIAEEPRVDEPPHEIEQPDVEGADEPWEAWNDHYLGEAMQTEPSLEFDAVSPARPNDPLVRYDEVDDEESAYAVRVVESEDELETVVDLEGTDDDARSTLEAVDFDDRVVVVVESGFGSGSVGHRWVRVEDVDDGLHLHGYYVQPFERTSDFTSRHSVLIVDRQAENGEFDLVRVSHTVSEERRVHYNSTEGLVTIED